MKVYTLPIEMVNALRSWFHPKDRILYLSDSQYIISQRVAWETTYSRYSLIPGTVGFWSMNNISRGTGDTYDSSPQNRTLTRNGSVEFGVWNGLVPYADFTTATSYLTRLDETDLDIRGTETIYPPYARGLTLGGWFKLDSLSGGSVRGFIGKYNSTGNQRAYRLALNSTDAALFGISTDGINDRNIGGSFMAQNKWYFVVGRFVPSQSIDIYVGDPNGEAPDDWVKNSNTTTIPSSLFASTADFEIGRYNMNSANIMDGQAALCFLSANALPDDLIEMLFQQSSVLFR